jgi:ATPase subunit of ABC transporter with duplicated ATPase domains
LSVTARTIANVEFHHTTDETNEAARKIVAELERIGVRAVNGGGDTIMARILAEKSESSFSQVIHSAGVRRSWQEF